ncbi:MAG: CrcB family protein [Wenzhouxiangellaceae bacterium]|nr:CrcB family protein [Wenzhouxiangellaceae bacterium]
MTALAAVAFVFAAALGSALGAVIRHSVSRRLDEPMIGGMPRGTLAVNLVGVGGAGLLLGFGSGPQSLPAALFGAGLLGGLTTVSSLALQTVLLAERRAASMALVYLFATGLGGLALAGAGIGLGRVLSGSPA